MRTMNQFLLFQFCQAKFFLEIMETLKITFYQAPPQSLKVSLNQSTCDAFLL